MAIPALILAWSIKQTRKPGRQIVFHAIACEDDAIPEDAPGLLNSEFFEFRPMRAPASALFGVDLSQATVTSHATLVRIDLPEIISGPDRILYLDCDVIVRKSLDTLFDVDLEERVIAASVDGLMMELIGTGNVQSKFVRHVASLVSDPLSYFNAGVLLIDCVKWRAGNYSARLKSLLLLPDRTFLFADQDVLNCVFQTDYKRLDPRWNAFAHYPSVKNKDVAAIAALCDADPWISHFAGSAKPWLRHQAQTPQHQAFWEIAKSSPFYEKALDLSNSASLGALPALRRGMYKKIAETLMTLSRPLHAVEVRLRKRACISEGIFSAAENLYQKSSN